jgi:dUTPase
MNIPFRVKTLTKTAKAPTQENQGDLWDIYADDFCAEYLYDTKTGSFNSDVYRDAGRYGKEHLAYIRREKDKYCVLYPQGRILVKTGISLELPKQYNEEKQWCYYLQPYLKGIRESSEVSTYAVADIRPRSGLALKHGITVLNTPGTIDNSYRKEIGVILYNAGHDTYRIRKGDKIAQMLIRPLYPSKMEIVDNINDTGRGGYGSTGK